MKSTLYIYIYIYIYIVLYIVYCIVYCILYVVLYMNVHEAQCRISYTNVYTWLFVFRFFWLCEV